MEIDTITLVGIAAGGFVIGILALAVILKMTALGMMVHEAKSPYDFDTTVDTIVTNTEGMGWKISKVYDLQKSAMDSGKGDVGRINVIQPIFFSFFLRLNISLLLIYQSEGLYTSDAIE
ncbi:MAG: hypothetical protein GWP10_06535 [Nitrospiraceae bacterium]|nr:hypothetical protein [Nitrospiraceae bacterium]